MGSGISTYDVFGEACSSLPPVSTTTPFVVMIISFHNGVGTDTPVPFGMSH
jgi:hypothetical protein